MVYISLGCSCATAYQLNKLEVRKKSYPFDWCKVSIKQLNLILENNFKYFNKVNIKKWSENHSSYLLENQGRQKPPKDGKRRPKGALGKFNKNYELELERLIKNLKLLFNNGSVATSKLDTFGYPCFKLILILPVSFQISSLNKNNDIYKIIRYENYDSDWKYNDINWSEIF